MKPARGVLGLALVAVIGACGASTVERANRALATALVATNAARDAFTEYDGTHQLQIVVQAPTREAAEAALTAYREKRAYIHRALVGAYTALAVAATVLPLVENGQRSMVDVFAALGDAAAALVEARRALDALKR
jgi:hypothetical protein